MTRTFRFEPGTKVTLEVLGQGDTFVSLDATEVFRSGAELRGHPALLDLTPRLGGAGVKQLTMEVRNERVDRGRPRLLAALILKKGLHQERVMTGDGTWLLSSGAPAVIVEGSAAAFPPPLSPVPRLLVTPNPRAREMDAGRDGAAFVARFGDGVAEVGYVDLDLPAACSGTIVADVEETFEARGGGVVKMGHRFAAPAVRISTSPDLPSLRVRFTPVGALLDEPTPFSCENDVLVRLERAASERAARSAQAFVETDPASRPFLEITSLRPSALALYTAYGDYRTVRISLEILAENRSGAGSVRAVYPYDGDGTAPEPSSAAAAFVLAVRDYGLYSGDLKLVRQLWPAIERQIEILHGRTDAMRLLRSGSRRGVPHVHESEANVLYAAALEAASEMAPWLGRTGAPRLHREAAAVNDSLRKRLLDPRRGLYAMEEHGDARVDAVGYGANVLAILYGIPPSGDALARIAALRRDESPGAFFIDAEAEAHFAAGDPSGALEALSVRDASAGAGSALPAYLARAYVLGIRPLSPGFRRFQIDPRYLVGATGSIATPSGPIAVRIEARGAAHVARVTIPAGLTGVLPPELAARGAIVDGARAATGRGGVIVAGGGTHEIEIPASSP
ncbi:MAG: alpha-L-rhamnosidase C-terminal domain-containing protein [Acidobacteriota bacterium]